LIAIILSNILVTILGASWSPLTAFIFIGFDITCRDKLHEIWYKKNLLFKMSLLILLGSFISFIINANTINIAIASFIAFSISSLFDSIIYGILFKHKKMVKINTSNIVSSLLDSIIFPIIAFGAFMPVIIFGQFIAKFCGGFIWSIVISKSSKTKTLSH
jgi:uncharacterized PurR-regulated membrane protein YhhQ (DUF165 family)